MRLKDLCLQARPRRPPDARPRGAVGVVVLSSRGRCYGGRRWRRRRYTVGDRPRRGLPARSRGARACDLVAAPHHRRVRAYPPISVSEWSPLRPHEHIFTRQSLAFFRAAVGVCHPDFAFCPQGTIRRSRAQPSARRPAGSCAGWWHSTRASSAGRTLRCAQYGLSICLAAISTTPNHAARLSRRSAQIETARAPVESGDTLGSRATFQLWLCRQVRRVSRGFVRVHARVIRCAVKRTARSRRVD